MKETGFVAYQHEVKAILEGRQTMFRRVIKPQPDLPYTDFHHLDVIGQAVFTDNSVIRCPYGQVGDRLWVRETFSTFRKNSEEESAAKTRAFNNMKSVGEMIAAAQMPYGHGDVAVLYAADYGAWAFDVDSDLKPWKPSIHMPRWASRITLEITGVKVERIQETTHEDSLAEGIYADAPLNDYGTGSTYIDIFAALWDSINAKRGYSWESNVGVWALTFKVVK